MCKIELAWFCGLDWWICAFLSSCTI